MYGTYRTSNYVGQGKNERASERAGGQAGRPGSQLAGGIEMNRATDRPTAVYVCDSVGREAADAQYMYSIPPAQTSRSGWIARVRKKTN